MPSITALVEPSLLFWARRRANIELIAADRKIDVPEGRVKEWEDGTTRPTIAQLRKAAEVYKRPLGVFFLPEPPEDFETLRDFRRIQGSEAAEWSAALHDEYRRAHAQRDALLEIADLDGSEPTRGVAAEGSPTTTSGSRLRARAALKRRLRSPTRRPARTSTGTWATGSRALEQMGVMVMQTQGGQVQEARCAPSRCTSTRCPSSRSTARTGPVAGCSRLIHEYAHLLLHTSGLATRRRTRAP